MTRRSNAKTIKAAANAAATAAAKTVAQEAKQTSAPKRRVRRRRKTRQNPQQFPGVLENEVSRPRARQTLVRPSKMARSVAPTLATHNLTKHGLEFIHRHCDPCGEMVTFRENAKIPDGAVPNSTALELRQVTIVRAPGASTSTIDLNSGAMWTLTVMHLPLFRTPCVLFASLNNAELTDADTAAFLEAWNTANTPPVSPEWWALSSDTMTYWTTIVWNGLADLPAPNTDGTTTSISQFRICADGITIFNNTPDLINQGMVIGAQWNTNQTAKVFDPEVATAGGVELRLGAYFKPTPTTTSAQTTLQVNIPASVDDGFVGITITGAATTTTYTSTVAFSTDSGSAAVGDVLTLNGTFTTTGQPVGYMAVDWTLTNTTTSDVLIAKNFSGAINFTTTYFDDFTVSATSEDHGSVTQFVLPPLTTESVIQTTPKAVYMTMKERNGVYMVKRIFQPVFNVAEAADYKHIRMASSHAAVDATDPANVYVSGKRDTFDQNYATGVIIMNSIPIACAPAFKMQRDYEVIAEDGSPWSVFMASNDQKEEPALEVVKAIASQHPMMYPEDYNALGGLMNILSGVISKIPLIGNVAPVVANVVSGLLGSQRASDGASQNRLLSTNDNEMSKLASALCSKLGL